MATPEGCDDDVSGPIRAGMRARAIADACERLDLAAILIDATGRVLHVGASASAALDGDVGLAAGHIVGRTPAANRRVERAVMVAMGQGLVAEAAEQPEEDALRLMGLPVADASPFQIMRGIVLLRRADDDAEPRVAALRSLLG